MAYVFNCVWWWRKVFPFFNVLQTVYYWIIHVISFFLLIFWIWRCMGACNPTSDKPINCCSLKVKLLVQDLRTFFITLGNILLIDISADAHPLYHFYPLRFNLAPYPYQSSHRSSLGTMESKNKLHGAGPLSRKSNTLHRPPLELFIRRTPPSAIALVFQSSLGECKKGTGLDATCPLNWSGSGVPFPTATMELSSRDVSACLYGCESLHRGWRGWDGILFVTRDSSCRDDLGPLGD